MTDTLPLYPDWYISKRVSDAPVPTEKLPIGTDGGIGMFIVVCRPVSDMGRPVKSSISGTRFVDSSASVNGTTQAETLGVAEKAVEPDAPDTAEARLSKITLMFLTLICEVVQHPFVGVGDVRRDHIAFSADPIVRLFTCQFVTELSVARFNTKRWTWVRYGPVWTDDVRGRGGPLRRCWRGGGRLPLRRTILLGCKSFLPADFAPILFVDFFVSWTVEEVVKKAHYSMMRPSTDILVKGRKKSQVDLSKGVPTSSEDRRIRSLQKRFVSSFKSQSGQKIYI